MPVIQNELGISRAGLAWVVGAIGFVAAVGGALGGGAGGILTQAATAGLMLGVYTIVNAEKHGWESARTFVLRVNSERPLAHESSTAADSAGGVLGK